MLITIKLSTLGFLITSILNLGVEGARFSSRGLSDSGLSGICPSSYPRLVMDERTGRCHETGSQGFCGRLAVVSSNPFNPNFGVCKCRQNYMNNSNCFGRPLIPQGDRCYFEFSQGPCKKGQWFIRNKEGRPECRKTPCPIIESQRDLFYSDLPETDFYFALYGGTNCFKTGTKGFCNKEERVYFLGTDPNPKCLTYDPLNCNAVSTINSISGGNDQANIGLVGFGVPYDGI